MFFRVIREAIQEGRFHEYRQTFIESRRDNYERVDTVSVSESAGFEKISCLNLNSRQRVKLGHTQI
jgi:hypothetical protein